MIEDDAQNGPDHVDAHTVGLVISPTFVAAPDSTQYSTVSMIRTMELILGLAEPVRRRRAAMFAVYRKPIRVPTRRKARIDVTAMNTPRTFGAARSPKWISANMIVSTNSS